MKMASITYELQRIILFRSLVRNRYICTELRQLRYNKKAISSFEEGSQDLNNLKKDIIISCKRTEFNHYRNQKYDKFTPVPLASKGWLNKKSRGDYFIINRIEKNPPKTESTSITFEETGLDLRIIEVLNKLGFSTPTEVQQRGIPSVLLGRNTILAAETGCGKTLAYLLPIMHHILKWKVTMEPVSMNCPLALVLSPNRELAQQIHDVMRTFSDELEIKTKVIVGGHTKKMMMNPEFDDVDILIGTLGAISKLSTVGIYNLSYVRHVVLDEADSLLDDSFSEKLNHFLKRIPFNSRTNHSSGCYPNGAQLTLASATMPRGAPDILASNVSPESLVAIKTKNLHHILSSVNQYFLRLGKSQKPGELIKILKAKKDVPTIVFSSKTETSQWLSMFLNENGINCLNLNGEMTVAARSGKFAQFQEGHTNVISCTDIGSRGLDTVQVQHVLNYEFPLHIADYIHRCGRTGRLGGSAECRVTNFISGPREIELVRKIELAVRNKTELPNVNANIKRLISVRATRGR